MITIRVVERRPLAKAWAVFNGKQIPAKRGKDGRLRITFSFAGRKYVQLQRESVALVGQRTDGDDVAATRSYLPCSLKLKRLFNKPWRL